MNKTDIRNSFKKVMLSFESDRSYRNFIRLLIAGFFSFALIIAYHIHSSYTIFLSLLILPLGLFWKAFDFYKKSKESSETLREVHNEEITDEIKKFSANGFKKSL